MRRGIGIAFMVFGGSAAVFVLLYLLDLLMSIGDVPAGSRWRAWRSAA
ncbi:hypothetical protein ACFSVJ_16220 [Prauserella oleivorans]